PEKKKFWLSRPFIFGAAGAAVLAVVIAVILASLPSGGASAPEKQLAAFQRGGEVIITRGEKILHTLPGTLSYLQHDTSRETMAVELSGGELYAVTPKKAERVSAAAAENFMLSQNGAMIYCPNPENSTETLRYNVKSGHTDIIPGQFTAVSPNGRTIGYAVGTSDGGVQIYHQTDNNVTVTQGAGYIVAVSDGAKFIYYLRDNALNVFDGKSSVQLVPDFSVIDQLIYSADMNEVIFSYEGRTYISRKGAEKERLTESALLGIPDCAVKSSVLTFYSGKRFAGVPLDCADGTYFMNNSGKAVKMSNASLAAVSADGRAAVLTDSDGRFYLSDVGESTSETHLKSFGSGDSSPVVRISKDGKLIYCLNSTGELYASKNGADSVLISSGVAAYALSPDGNTAYYITDYSNGIGDLYVSTGAGKGKLTEGIGDVTDVRSSPSGTYVYTNPESTGAALFYANKSEFARIDYGIAYTDSGITTGISGD
ncbi:MAG: hypothetical protein LBR85_08215, partial [Oscillospiraceae bacterium]|nr:hypothetical protein [Oscillospiraceae bacterium]